VTVAGSSLPRVEAKTTVAAVAKDGAAVAKVTIAGLSV